MKNFLPVFFVLVFISGACGPKPHEHHQEQVAGDSVYQALNEMVMNIHDEVMPKMEDLYRLKKKFQDSITNTKGISAEKKGELEAMILSLDSASHAMTEWMHGFNPEKDSSNQEKMREYFETQIEKINRIKERTNEVIQKAEGK